MNDDVARGRICPYCGGVPLLVDSAVVYGRSYGPIWRCPRCGAYVGCHKGTDKPLGRLADARLRAAKKSAHASFDTIWISRRMRRGEAYSWLSKKLGIPIEDTHIGMMDIETCELVIAYATAFLQGKVS